MAQLCFRPLSRYGWFPTNYKKMTKRVISLVSGPSRGMGGFLLGINWHIGERSPIEFPAPLEVWVGSYYDFFKNYRTCA